MWGVCLLSDNNSVSIMRQHEVFVQVETTPAAVKRGATVATSGQASFSRSDQLVNHIAHAAGRIATFEPDFWRLDGSFMLPPANHDGLTEVGFVSSQISSSSGNFAVNPEIAVDFATPFSPKCVSMVFDTATGEVVDTARFRCFDPAGQVVLDETISGNRAIQMTTRGGATNVARVVVELIRTAQPFRRGRVVELHFGPVLEFDNNDIVSVTNIRQGDPSGRSLPTNKLTARILNKARFDVLDDTSYAADLTERLTMTHTHSIKQGNRQTWTFCGNFYLDSWTIRNEHVKLLGYGGAKRLGDEIYRESAFAQHTLGAIARHVAADAGFEVIVPPVMNMSPLFPRFLGNVSHRAALSVIAQAACCMLFEDTRGRLRFVDMLDATGGEPASVLDYEVQFAPPKVDNTAEYSGILLREHFVSLEAGRPMLAAVDVAGVTDVLIPFDRPIYSGGAVAASAGFVLTNVRFFAMYMTATVHGTGRCELTISGNRAFFAAADTFHPAAWFADDASNATQKPYVVDLPLFLTNVSRIDEIRNWYLARKFALLANRVTCNASWRQDPAVGIGDAAVMQVHRDGRAVGGVVVLQEMEYERGVLRGRTVLDARD